MASVMKNYYQTENHMGAMAADLPMPKGQRAHPTTDGPSAIMSQLARLDAGTCQLNEFLEKFDQRLAPISISVPTEGSIPPRDEVDLSPVAAAISQSCYRVEAAMRRVLAMMDALQL